MIAPAPVKTHARIETGPAVLASDAGSRNTPDPIMLPTTSAVAIHRPIERLNFGRAVSLWGGAARIVTVAMTPSFQVRGWVRLLPRPMLVPCGTAVIRPNPLRMGANYGRRGRLSPDARSRP